MFNLGFRQALGSWLGSISYDGVRGYHGFTWLSAAPNGLCCAALVPGFGWMAHRRVFAAWFLLTLAAGFATLLFGIATPFAYQPRLASPG